MIGASARPSHSLAQWLPLGVDPMPVENTTPGGPVGDLVRAVVGPEGAELMEEMAKDPAAFLNTPRVPDDAGEYAEGIAAILARIPPGWGRWIGCGKGWYPLLLETDQKLAALDPEYLVHQVKEKFGGLRFYHQFVTEGADYHAGGAIEVEAERKSFTICEVCGEPGQLRDGGWRQTLGELHAEGRGAIRD